MPILVRGKPAVILLSHCTMLGVRRPVWPANNDLTGSGHRAKFLRRSYPRSLSVRF
jgi:hypothetical protein